MDAINSALKKADEAGIKLIFVDSSANYDCIASFATNSENAGKMAGETMKKALSEKGIFSGTIGIFQNKEGTSTTTARDNGFRSAFEDTAYTLANTVFMNDDPQNVKDEIVLHPEYVGFYGTNERTTIAIGEQLLALGSGQIEIGFDTSDVVLSLVNKGIIYATMQQQPKKMGYEGMKAAVNAINGSLTGKNIKTDTGVAVIDKSSI